MLLVSTSKAGNLVTVDMIFGEEGVMLEFTSKETVVIEGVSKDVTFIDAMNRIKTVLSDEEINL